MNIRAHVTSYLTALIVAAAPPAIFAELNFFQSLDPAGALTEGDAAYDGGFGQHAGIELPDGSTSSFALGFAVPPEHPVGEPLLLGIWWHTGAASTPCTAVLRPNFISVATLNSGHIVGPGADTGLSPQDGAPTLDATAPNVTRVKLYTIDSPDGVTPLRPFDAINFGLFRPSADFRDDCDGGLVIQGIAVGSGTP